MQLQGMSAEQLLSMGGYHQGLQQMVPDQSAPTHMDQQPPQQDMTHASDGAPQPHAPVSTAS